MVKKLDGLIVNHLWMSIRNFRMIVLLIHLAYQTIQPSKASSVTNGNIGGLEVTKTIESDTILICSDIE